MFLLKILANMYIITNNNLVPVKWFLYKNIN